jgi:hypothetical protein
MASLKEQVEDQRSTIEEARQILEDAYTFGASQKFPTDAFQK